MSRSRARKNTRTRTRKNKREKNEDGQNREKKFAKRSLCVERFLKGIQKIPKIKSV
jgi:hypothetical protein